MRLPLCLLLAACASLAAGADVFLEPAEAGPDYALQGEYASEGKDGRIGAQVIALGAGAFRLVLLPGGLPGAGWTGMGKVEIEGRGENGKAVFQGADKGGWRAQIANGAMAAVSDKERSFALKRVERQSPTLGAKPPAGAVVLLDGSSAEAWDHGKLDGRMLLHAGCTSKRAFGDFSLHLEFLLPFKPAGRGQDRGNSGLYLQNRYEVQVLDSFGLSGENNECGGIYTQAKPAVNMCYPPLAWQTYDIEFTAARFDAQGQRSAKARATVKHNGVTIHENLEFSGPTGGGQPEGATPGPFQLQGHGNPVFYRNIWVVEKR